MVAIYATFILFPMVAYMLADMVAVMLKKYKSLIVKRIHIFIYTIGFKENGSGYAKIQKNHNLLTIS